MTDPLIIAVITGAVSSGLTIGIIKTDIVWLKRTMSQLQKRVLKLERELQ